jgi:hypothetical protein
MTQPIDVLTHNGSCCPHCGLVRRITSAGQSLPKLAIPVTSLIPQRAAVLQTLRHFAFVLTTDLALSQNLVGYSFGS